MPQSNQQIDLLWTTVFGQPPPIVAAPALLLAVLVEYLPLAPPYGASLAAAGDPVSDRTGAAGPVEEQRETKPAAVCGATGVKSA